MKSKSVLLIIPSIIVARGLENVLSELGEFEVKSILSDLSSSSVARLRNMHVDVVVFDPSVLDYTSRLKGKSMLSSYTDAPIVAFFTSYHDEELMRQYEHVIGLFDDPTTIVRKLRAALEAKHESAKGDGEELSVREKEILVSVAKGMLNKEIADMYNISIHTVITHRKNITRKTGIKTVAGLTIYALLNNLLDMNSLE